MTKEIADFIKANQQLIEVGDFRKLYENTFTWFIKFGRYASISEITELFEAAGIDPLYYMNDIPTGYHFESTLPKTYSIGNIDTIGSYAFAYTTGIDTLDISSVRYIGEFAFYGDRYLSDIYYNGTKEAVRKVWTEAMDGLGLNYTIHCTDGDLEL